MFRLIFLLIAFYIIYKAIRIFLFYFIPSLKGNSNIKNEKTGKSKFKDVEEVKFTEIKSEAKTEKE